MTNHEHAKTQEIAPTYLATEKFAKTFNRFLPRYADQEGFADMRAQAGELSDVARNGDTAHGQQILETTWPKDLDDIRLDALTELYAAENGQPTPEQKGAAYRELQHTVLRGERNTTTDERVRLVENMSSTKPEDIKEIIDLIEWQISELNIIPDDERRNKLRIARNIMHERHKGYKEAEEIAAREEEAANKQRELEVAQTASEHHRAHRVEAARAEVDGVFLKPETPEQRAARKARTVARERAK